jgi:hypothetical protein
MTATEGLISITFDGFWLAGTGAARGRAADTFAHRDPDGNPAMPMSQVKGQIRETAARLVQAGAGGWTAEAWALLFGSGDDSGRAEAGALDFGGDAQLTGALRAHLADNPAGRVMLFHNVSATKINSHGVAADMTLRTVEAVAPLTLVGRIRWIAATAPLANWIELLDSACAASLAFGKQKSDGFGRATARFEAVQKEPPR